MEIKKAGRQQGAEPAATQTTIRVLIIDDDDLDFVAVTRLLSKPEGEYVFETIQAPTLAEAFRSLTAFSFDIALVDYFLGPACGLDLIRRLGGRNSHTPFIVLTGSRDPKIVAEILETGVTNYLCKEFLDGDQLRPLLLNTIQQHRMELQLLRKSGVLIDTASPIAGMGYFDLQIETKTLLWSRESYAIWGVVPGEFTPTPENVRTLVHTEDRHRFDDILRSKNPADELDLRIRLKGGAERIIHTIVSRFREENGRVARLHGIFHDVTTQRKTEGKLYAEQRKYQQLFENSDVSLLLADCSELVAEVEDHGAAGHDVRTSVENDKEFLRKLVDRFQITDANRAAMTMFGIEAKSSLDEPALLPIREALVRELAGGLRQKAASVRSECLIETEAGPRSVVFSLPVPTNYTEAKNVPVSVIDLTNVHDAEIANRANAAKSTFLARMSHELRTPLNGVLSNIELLQDTALSNEQISLVQSARLSGDTLLHLIGDILDFSKIEAGKTELEQTTFRLPQILLDLDAMFRARAISEGIAFIWRLDGAAPERVEGDPLRLKQVLINLVGNAMRYTKEGGVFVRASAGPAVDGKTVLKFEIIDLGMGLDAQTTARLFDPFTQADASNTRTHGGTGLGLAICKSLVELWGGEIGVDGTVGVGAHFWFTVPVKVVEPAPTYSLADLHRLGGRHAAANHSILVLLTPDRTDNVLLDHLKRVGMPNQVVGDSDELLRLCETAIAAGQRSPPCIVQESRDGPPPTLAREVLARKSHVVLHLYGNDVRRYQRALRMGYAAFQPPVMDNATDVRSAILTIEKLGASSDSALGNFGLAGSEGVRNQLARMKESLRILILEDQPMNQLVIERQMSRLGLRHDVAENGILGLKYLEGGHYNLILCDCSMPHMDGFEFTRNVRAREKAGGKPHIPIIALTANVFTEDVERCQKAGMDDFLAKPVKLEELAAKILAWARSSQAATAQKRAEEPPAAAEADPIDTTVLPEALGSDDPESLAIAYRLYLSEIDKHVDRMKSYLVNHSATDLNRTAHGAKGDSRNAGAKKLGDLLQELETAASASEWDSANTIYDKVLVERTRVTDFIKERLLPSTEAAA